MRFVRLPFEWEAGWCTAGEEGRRHGRGGGLRAALLDTEARASTAGQVPRASLQPPRRHAAWRGRRSPMHCFLPPPRIPRPCSARVDAVPMCCRSSSLNTASSSRPPSPPTPPPRVLGPQGGGLYDFFTMVMAGLVAATPHMIAASVMALARLTFEFAAAMQVRRPACPWSSALPSGRHAACGLSPAPAPGWHVASHHTHCPCALCGGSAATWAGSQRWHLPCLVARPARWRSGMCGHEDTATQDCCVKCRLCIATATAPPTDPRPRPPPKTK